MSEILVLGGGAWGTALANLLAENTKKKIYLWSFEKEVANTINSKFINEKYLPSKKINKNIIASSYLPKLNISIVFVVIPSQFIYSFFKKHQKHFYSLFLILVQPLHLLAYGPMPLQRGNIQ